MSATIRTVDPADHYEIIIYDYPKDTANIIARWGWINGDGSMLVESQIVVLQGSGAFAPGANIVADFRPGNAEPAYLYFAERATEPVKTKWYGSGIDQGAIGPGQVFAVMGAVSGWRVYRSASKTTFSTTTEFRTE